MITAMRSRRSGVSCISYHGYVYVIGIKICTYYERNPINPTKNPTIVKHMHKYLYKQGNFPKLFHT